MSKMPLTAMTCTLSPETAGDTVTERLARLQPNT